MAEGEFRFCREARCLCGPSKVGLGFFDPLKRGQSCVDIMNGKEKRTNKIPRFFRGTEVSGDPFIPTDVLDDFETACWGAIGDSQGITTKEAIERWGKVGKFKGVKGKGLFVPEGPVCTRKGVNEKSDTYKAFEYASRVCQKNDEDKEQCTKEATQQLEDDVKNPDVDKKIRKGLEKIEIECQWTDSNCFLGLTSESIVPTNIKGWVP